MYLKSRILKYSRKSKIFLLRNLYEMIIFQISNIIDKEMEFQISYLEKWINIVYK